MNTFSIEIKGGKPCSLVVGNHDFVDIDLFVKQTIEIESYDAVKVAIKAFKDELGLESNWSNVCGNESNRPLPTHDFWRGEDEVKIAHARIQNALKVAHGAAVDFLESILPDGIYSVSETVEVQRSRR